MQQIIGSLVSEEVVARIQQCLDIFKGMERDVNATAEIEQESGDTTAKNSMSQKPRIKNYILFLSNH